MKKQTKLKIIRLATGAAVCASAVGIIMFCGRSSSTHAASQFTHGLKVIGEVFGGGMYRGATVVAGASVAASEIVDSAANYVIPDDIIAQTVGTPPPAATDSDPEPRFSEYNDMTAFVDALRKWEARQPDADEDIVAQYDRWEEAQRARRASQPVHPMYTGKLVSLDEARRINVLDFIDQDDLDEAI